MSSSTTNLHRKVSPGKHDRIMWREAKKRTDGFKHIKICLAGHTDVAVCTLCELQIDLEAGMRSKDSVLLETARKHYYKHKLDRKPESSEVENGER